MLKLLTSVSAKWQEIGDLLGVDSDTIEGLYTSNVSNQVKMSKMLQCWLDNAPTPVTWHNIISVLEGPLKEKSIANKIRNTLASIYSNGCIIHHFMNKCTLALNALILDICHTIHTVLFSLFRSWQKLLAVLHSTDTTCIKDKKNDLRPMS